jgi:hypothetical protein
MLIFTEGGNRRSIERTTHQTNSIHMVYAELEPLTRTFGTTVVKDDALAAYTTHVGSKVLVQKCWFKSVGSKVLVQKCWFKSVGSFLEMPQDFFPTELHRVSLPSH